MKTLSVNLRGVTLFTFATALLSCAGANNPASKRSTILKPVGWKVHSQPQGEGTIPVSFVPITTLTNEGTTIISILPPEIEKGYVPPNQKKGLQTQFGGKTITYSTGENYMATYIMAPIRINNQNVVANLIVSKPSEKFITTRKEEFFQYVIQFQ